MSPISRQPREIASVDFSHLQILSSRLSYLVNYYFKNHQGRVILVTAYFFFFSSESYLCFYTRLRLTAMTGSVIDICELISHIVNIAMLIAIVNFLAGSYLQGRFGRFPLVHPSPNV
jgi:hypothetical protein